MGSAANPVFTLRQLIPRSILAGRWVVVLVCYLDDSGKDPQSRITTLAGFIAPEACWEAFELTVKPIFDEFGVDVLHAKPLHDTDGSFAGWTINKKRAFVTRICEKMRGVIPLGVAMSAVKEAYAGDLPERPRKRQTTAYAFCFNSLLDKIFADIRVGKQANEDGVAFVLEAGHEHNPDAERVFHDLQRKFPIPIRSISFVGKASCYAIQVADLFAFHVRRHGAAQEKVPPEMRKTVPPDPMLDIIQRYVPAWAIIAERFGRGTHGTAHQNLFFSPRSS